MSAMQALQVVPSQDEQEQQFLARVRAVRNVIAKNCSEEELIVFAQACQQTGLNPFAKQIYAIKRGDQLTIQTAVDGFRVIAERSGKYRGQKGPEWCGKDGVWHDVWLSSEPPAACRVGVLRSDFDEPVWGVARTEAYRVDSNPLWKKMPEVMIARSAEVLAMRKAFPNDLSGIYGTEEMEQAGTDYPNVVEAAPVPAQRPARPATESVLSGMRDEQVSLQKLYDRFKQTGTPMGEWTSAKRKHNGDLVQLEQYVASLERSKVQPDDGELTDAEIDGLFGTGPLA